MKNKILILEIEPKKETNNCQLSSADPANIEGQDDMDLDSLPSSQNTIADEEESREYIEAENDQKCDTCKMQALRMKIGENRVEHQAKEIKYLKRQRTLHVKHFFETWFYVMTRKTLITWQNVLVERYQFVSLLFLTFVFPIIKPFEL